MDRATAKDLLVDIKNEFPDLLEMLEIRKNQISKKVIYSFQIQESMLERAKKISKKEKISVSNVMRQAIAIGIPELEV